MAARTIDFFYGIGSRYSYLASTRIDRAWAGYRNPLSGGARSAARS